jgi:hypothetical protein
MKTKEEIITILKTLPIPLLGGILFQKGHLYDGKAIINIRDSCINMIKEVFEISKAKEILEIGTHGGSGSLIFLSLTNSNVTSIDLCDGTGHVELEFTYNDYNVPGTQPGINKVIEVFNKEFPGRFRFIAGSSYAEETINKYNDRRYDLVFIDGDHSFQGCRKDCENSVKLGIKYLLVDDYTTSEDIRKACDIPELELVKIYPNIHNAANIGIALFKNKNCVENV